jgi:REP element-mobilizing transposase RayT
MCNGTKKFKFKDLIKVEKNSYDFERGKTIVDIISYVLMPNHFHLFLTPNSGEGKRTDVNIDSPLSVFMKRVTTAYSQYYNYKYKRSGTLFEGRFKAEHVNSNEYFKYLFSYINLNPVKLIQKDWKENGLKDFQGASNFLQNYKYSSFPVYFYTPYPVGGERKIVTPERLFEKIEKGTDLNKEIFDWLNFRTIN